MKKKIFFLTLNVLVFIGIVLLVIKTWKGKQNIIEQNCATTYIEKIYDGDTIVWKNVGKIRILWIDTPEIYHTGWTEVKDYKFYACWKYGLDLAKKYLLHKNIKYCYDKLEDKTWWYGRTLAYVYFTWENNNLVDFWKMLVTLWYAKVYKAANYSKKKEYLKLEKIAKQKHLWIRTKECIEKDKNFKKLMLKKFKK